LRSCRKFWGEDKPRGCGRRAHLDRALKAEEEFIFILEHW
jgi:hypothetical protein